MSKIPRSRPCKAKHEAARRAERAPGHAELVLPSVTVDTYNEELRDEDGFVGDRASGRAFRAILDDWRERIAQNGEDPLGRQGDARTSPRASSTRCWSRAIPVAAGLIHSAVEEFAQELATVVRRFLRLEKWKGTERIVVGGGLSSSHIGRLAMGRAAVLLNAEGTEIELVPIEYHHDEAGLIGSLHFAPGWVFTGHDAILAADIGGTNLRVGVVKHNASKKSDLSKASVWKLEHWKHAARQADPRGGGRADRRHDERADRPGGGREGEAGAVRRHRLPRHHRRGRRDPARRPEPARQLGGRGLQPAAGACRRGCPRSTARRRWW